MKELTDEAIISQLKEGFDARLFALLTDSYQSKVLARCKTVVKDDDAAEDLVQEVFIKLFLKMDTFKGVAKFSTWLETITINTALDYSRKNKKKYHEAITEKLADSVEDLIDSDEPVEEEVSIQIMEQLLEELSPEDKLILMLKHYEKASVKEIQIALSIGESAVKMRLKRARDRINKLRQKFLEEEQERLKNKR